MKVHDDLFYSLGSGPVEDLYEIDLEKPVFKNDTPAEKGSPESLLYYIRKNVRPFVVPKVIVHLYPVEEKLPSPIKKALTASERIAVLNIYQKQKEAKKRKRMALIYKTRKKMNKGFLTPLARLLKQITNPLQPSWQNTSKVTSYYSPTL